MSTLNELSNLQEFAKQARLAYYWSSFDPDKRAESTLREHQNMLMEDLKEVPETEQERYIKNFKVYFSAWLSAHSKCVNWAVTGRSGLNIRKVQQANEREQIKYQDFLDWREKAKKQIAKNIRDSRSPEMVMSEDWKRLENDILHSAAVIHGINNGTERGYHKALFVSSIYNKVETFAKHGNSEIVEKAIACIRNFNTTMSVVITERHKFFKLLDVAEQNKEKKEDKSNQDSKEFSFENLTIVFNYSLDRLQIIFSAIPTAEVRTQLKKNAYKWSPNNSAWQRQLTPNAIYSLRFLTLLNLDIEKIK